MISPSEMQKIAKNIVGKSMNVKPKEAVSISTGPNSIKFAEMLAYEAAIIGANPSISYSSDELSLKIFQKINPKYLRTIPKLSKILAKKVDVEIMIDDSNPFVSSLLPMKKLEIRRKALKPVKDIKDLRFVRKTIKSVLLGYPNRETAKALGISFDKLNSIFWKTLSTDTQKMLSFNNKIIARLRNANKIHIVGEKTDLEFSIKGREPLSDCGLWVEDKIGYLNLPAGEVFYAPVETSANGHIYFDLPCMWHFGKKVRGVYFVFKDGRVVDYKLDKGQKVFEDVMKNASGVKDRIAELGIGTNPNARPTGGLTLVDEKLMGTIHIAIGWNKGYGGKNDATIHWDFFKDMHKKGSVVYVDGKPFMKNGKFIGLK
jgi:aminopeptidase